MTQTPSIEIRDAHENNLKHIDLTVSKHKLVVFTGVSGSGKSSLVLDTLAVESSRQWQMSYPMFLRNKMPHYERPKVGEIRHLPPAIVIDQKPLGANARSTVGSAVDAAPLLRLLFSRVGEPSAGGSMAYSAHHPLGMCPDCTGLGEVLQLDEDSLFDPARTLRGGGILFSQFAAGWQSYLYLSNPLLNPDKPLRDFSAQEWDILRNGADNPPKIEIRSNNTGRVDKVDYEGVVPRFRRLYLNRDIAKLKQGLQDEIRSHVFQTACKSCGGSGLNAAALSSRINGLNIVQAEGLSARALQDVLQTMTHPVGVSLAAQLSAQLQRMTDVGIGYLALNRKTDTLSGGEAQRLKLVRHLGSSLSDVMYVFDEPTAGLHPADAEKIGRRLLGLRNGGNHVLVVEHNPQIMALADEIIELGEGAGEHGGEVVFSGSLQDLRQRDTATARLFRQKIPVNTRPLAWQNAFEIRQAKAHHLKNVDVAIPQGVLTAVAGVAGSGKSSLACVELPHQFPETIVIDQKPIGTSSRSTPATYTGVMDDIRKLFAKANSVDASWFSFNSKGGCEACKGKGETAYDMAFADAVVETCEECGGRRYNATALSYRYQNLTIEEVLNLTLEQAFAFFENRKIRQALQLLLDVGLGYLTLGQPTGTLSGGEIQRIKLASELHRQGRLYVLDEPSTGLHHQDAQQLLALLRKLVDNGNTVVIVEHRLALIAAADWIIELGKGGGADGGEVVFTGTPEQLLKCGHSVTAEYLRKAAGFQAV